MDVHQHQDELFILSDNEIWLAADDSLGLRLHELVPGVDRFSTNGWVTTDDGIFFVNEGLFVTPDAIWRTDGTTEGTRPVASLPQLYGPAQLVRAEGDFYWVETTLLGKHQIHRSNGTDGHRELVVEIEGDPLASPNTPTLYGTPLGLFLTIQSDDRMLLVNSQLETLAELGVANRMGVEVEMIGESVFVSTVDWMPLHDRSVCEPVFACFRERRRVWSSDGSPDNTKLIHSSELSIIGVAQNISLTSWNGMPVFYALSETTNIEPELWVIDTNENRAFVYDVSFQMEDPVPFQGQLYVTVHTPKYGSELWALVDPRTITGDIDGDGTVGFADFTTLSSEYGQTGDDLVADVDGDGDVDFNDFLTFTRNFGREKPTVPDSAEATLEPRIVDLALIDA